MDWLLSFQPRDLDPRWNHLDIGHLDHLVYGSLGHHLDPHPECHRHGETVEPDLSLESDPSKSHFWVVFNSALSSMRSLIALSEMNFIMVRAAVRIVKAKLAIFNLSTICNVTTRLQLWRFLSTLMGYFNKTSYLFLQTDTQNNVLWSLLYSIKSSEVSQLKPVIIAIIKTMITT